MKFFNNLLREKSTKPNPGLLAAAINDHWHPKPRRLMLALEPRIMFDGAAVETAADTAFDPGSLARDNAVVDQDEEGQRFSAHRFCRQMIGRKTLPTTWIKEYLLASYECQSNEKHKDSNGKYCFRG